MYKTPLWYQEFRYVFVLWKVFAGTYLFRKSLPNREREKTFAALFWGIGSVLFLALYNKPSVLDYIMPGTIMVYLVNILMVWACCRVSFNTAFLVGACGYLLQHICGNFELTLRMIPFIGRIVNDKWTIVPFDLAIHIAGYLLIFYLFRDGTLQDENEISDKQKLLFSLLSITFTMLTFVANQYFVGWKNVTDESLTIEALSSFFGGILMLILIYDIIRRNRAVKEANDAMVLMRLQASQYQAGIENAELVNEKYHDLKKMIRSFKGQMAPEQMEKLLLSVDSYDDRVRTGNEIVDIVLTEARTICRMKNIQMTCFVNGAELAFVEDLDLYFILKNMLDNAIEGVSQLAEGQAKFISLKAGSDSGVASIHMENPCSAVVFSGSVPVTDKDPLYHGYGVKSMQHISEKYGGTLSMKVKDNIFYTDILLIEENR